MALQLPSRRIVLAIITCSEHYTPHSYHQRPHPLELFCSLLLQVKVQQFIPHQHKIICSTSSYGARVSTRSRGDAIVARREVCGGGREGPADARRAGDSGRDCRAAKRRPARCPGGQEGQARAALQGNFDERHFVCSTRCTAALRAGGQLPIKR